jgi:hypothetical protein
MLMEIDGKKDRWIWKGKQVAMMGDQCCELGGMDIWMEGSMMICESRQEDRRRTGVDGVYACKHGNRGRALLAYSKNIGLNESRSSSREGDSRILHGNGSSRNPPPPSLLIQA